MLQLLGILFLYLISVNSECQKTEYSEYVFNVASSNLKWPCDSTKSIYVQTQRYIPENVIVTRGQLQKDNAFVAIPRLKRGTPVTLGQIKLKKGQCDTNIIPYPTWHMQEEGNCDSFQSVVDVFLDSKGILWVLDTGICNALEQPIRRCPPRIYGIKISTNRIVKKIDISNLVSAESRLQFIITEYADEKPFVYVSDGQTSSIIVYNVSNDKGHKIVLPSAVISNKNDVLYIALALSPPIKTKIVQAQSKSSKSCKCGQVEKTEIKEIEIKPSSAISLYFTYLKSKHIYAINTENVRNGAGSGAIVDIGIKPNSLPMALLGGNNDFSAIYLRYIGQNDIYRYDVTKCLKMSNLEEIYNGGDCRLSTQVIAGSGNFLWNLESNFQDYLNGTTGCTGASVLLHPIYKEPLKS